MSQLKKLSSMRRKHWGWAQMSAGDAEPHMPSATGPCKYRVASGRTTKTLSSDPVQANGYGSQPLLSGTRSLGDRSDILILAAGHILL